MARLAIVIPVDDPGSTTRAQLGAALEGTPPPAKLADAHQYGWTLGELLAELLEAAGLEISEDDDLEADLLP